MGVDIEVYFKTTKPEIWNGDTLFLGVCILSDNEDMPEANFNISSMVRLYDFDYERGPWPEISADLIKLMSAPDVEKVWYGGDCNDVVEEMTFDRLIKLTDHYIKNQNRPYEDYFKELK